MTAPTAEYVARVKRQGGLSDKKYAEKLAREALAASPVETLEPAPTPTTPVLRRMVDVLRGVPTAPVEGAATLAFDDATAEAPPVWPRNPVPIGEPARRPSRAPRGRPPGAEDIQPLFATGLVLLTAFAVGRWAAPTDAEADAIAVPLSNILARRIDLAAKLGRDANDTIALSVALMAYGYRVGPLVYERVRSNVDSRRGGSRSAAEPAVLQGADGLVPGSGNGASPTGGPTYNPFDAIVRAREAGLGILDRDLGASSNGDPSVGDRG